MSDSNTPGEPDDNPPATPGVSPELFAAIKTVYVSAVTRWVEAKRNRCPMDEARYWSVVIALETAYPNIINTLENYFLRTGGINAKKEEP